MTPKASAPKTKSQQRKQADDFESVAKRLECDENKERFEKRLGKIARAPAAPRKTDSVR
jgi:hypothetical protein